MLLTLIYLLIVTVAALASSLFLLAAFIGVMYLINAKLADTLEGPVEIGDFSFDAVSPESLLALAMRVYPVVAAPAVAVLVLVYGLRQLNIRALAVWFKLSNSFPMLLCFLYFVTLFGLINIVFRVELRKSGILAIGTGIVFVLIYMVFSYLDILR